MITILPLALIGMLAAAVSSTPFHPKRQADGQQVIFRSDLKQGEGQSPEFKDLFLSHTATNITGQYDITFVERSEMANADHATIESRGIPVGLGNLTLYMNMGQDKANPHGPQPVTLGTKQQSAGWFYAVGGELKSASSTPQWDTWLICPGDAGYPKLFWVGVVNLLVEIPAECSAVRLFADSVSGGAAQASGSSTLVSGNSTLVSGGNSTGGLPQCPATCACNALAQNGLTTS